MRPVLFCLLLLMCGCVTPVPPEKAAGIRVIGVASGCGRSVTRESYAFVVFGDEITTGDISDWRLDDRAADTVAAAVRPRLELRPIDVDFAALEEWDASSFRLTPLPDTLKRAIHPPAEPVHAYLLVTKGVVGARPQRRHGMGVWSVFGLQRAHAVCQLRLLDPRTFETIAEGTMQPEVPLPADLHLDRWDLYDEGQRQRVRLALEEALDAGLKQILAEMKMVP